MSGDPQDHPESLTRVGVVGNIANRATAYDHQLLAFSDLLRILE